MQHNNLPPTRIIKIGDVRNESTWQTTVLQQSAQDERKAIVDQLWASYVKESRRSKTYIETGKFTESFIPGNGASLFLRNGFRFTSFAGYEGLPPSYPAFCEVQQSFDEFEQYARDGGMPPMPKVPSGQPAPLLSSTIDGGIRVQNFRYAGRIEITADDLRFDQLGKMRQRALELGRSGRLAEEQAVYSVVADSSKYTRNSTTGDNDIGANYSTTAFGGVAFETAMATLQTMKDRGSGYYLGMSPNCIVIPPLMEVPVKMLLQSGNLVRVGGNTTNEKRGTGSDLNVYRGMLDTIIVSPFFGQLVSNYGWLLVDTRRSGIIFQRLDPFEVQEDSPTTESRLVRNVLTMVAAGYFGCDIIDDRSLYLSASVTAPVIA